MFLRLTVTNVVFEYYFPLYMNHVYLRINSNKCCFWIYRGGINMNELQMINSNKCCFWISLEHARRVIPHRLTVTNVVFELSVLSFLFWSIKWLTVTNVVFEFAIHQILFITQMWLTVTNVVFEYATDYYIVFCR